MRQGSLLGPEEEIVQVSIYRKFHCELLQVSIYSKFHCELLQFAISRPLTTAMSDIHYLFEHAEIICPSGITLDRMQINSYSICDTDNKISTQFTVIFCAAAGLVSASVRRMVN